MQKAYDLKELGLLLKAEGLEIAEESLKIVAKSLFDWFELSAKVSENTYDDLAMILLPKIRAYALEGIDKINPED